MASSARTVTAENAVEIAEWCKGKIVEEHDALDHSAISLGINVPCEDGKIKRASMGDIVIHQNNGTFTVFKY